MTRAVNPFMSLSDMLSSLLLFAWTSIDLHGFMLTWLLQGTLIQINNCVQIYRKEVTSNFLSSHSFRRALSSIPFKEHVRALAPNLANSSTVAKLLRLQRGESPVLSRAPTRVSGVARKSQPPLAMASGGGGNPGRRSPTFGMGGQHSYPSTGAGGS